MANRLFSPSSDFEPEADPSSTTVKKGNLILGPKKRKLPTPAPRPLLPWPTE